MYTWLYKKLPHCFTEWLCHFHCYQICTSDPPCWFFRVFYCSHSNRGVMVSHHGFNLHFTNGKWHWTYTCASVCYLYHLHLLKCLFNSLDHFLIGLFVSLLLSLRSSLYILDTSPLSDMRLANYRPPFFSLSFHPLVAAQSLSRVQLFVTPWTAAHQASLSFTISWVLLKLMSIESVMPRDFYSPKLLVLMESSVFFFIFFMNCAFDGMSKISFP